MKSQPIITLYIVLFENSLKALANEDTLLRTQLFPRLPERATFVVDTYFVSGTQKMFLIFFRNILCSTNVSQFAQPKKNHEQQCVRNNASSFARAFKLHSPIRSCNLKRIFKYHS